MNTVTGLKELNKILLVDHDLVSNILISEILFDRNVDLSYAESGTDAIRIFTDNPFFNLVITELKLTDMDGFDVLKEIRKINPVVPVIAQTDHSDHDTKKKCLQEGFDYFIKKPINVKSFMKNENNHKQFVHILQICPKIIMI